MAPRTGQGLQERAWDAPTKDLLWDTQTVASTGRRVGLGLWALGFGVEVHPWMFGVEVHPLLFGVEVHPQALGCTPRVPPAT